MNHGKNLLAFFFFCLPEQVTRNIYPRIEHAVVRAGGTDIMVFGGGSNDSYLADMGFITLGCNRGSASEDFSSIGCTLCPLGSYAAEPGMSTCSGKCVDKVTTGSTGSWSEDNCTLVSLEDIGKARDGQG